MTPQPERQAMSKCAGILGRIFGHKFVHCRWCMWEPGYCLRCGIEPEVKP